MVVFLFLYSYVVLVDLRPVSAGNSLSVAECVLWGWEITLIIEEFRQVIHLKV